ncbi:MAG: protein kinase family protein, partial [Proteobacteria bacterium]|nr:protein kinase family protein [Pseudomonadota bacterium]
RSALGLLNVLALVQWRLGPPELPGLANWVGEHLTPVIASFHNRAERLRLEKELPNFIAKGDLSELFNFLSDSGRRERDQMGFVQASDAYAAAEAEIAQLRSGAADPERARTAGHRLAVGVTTVLSLAAIAGLSMLNLQ